MLYFLLGLLIIAVLLSFPAGRFVVSITVVIGVLAALVTAAYILIALAGSH